MQILQLVGILLIVNSLTCAGWFYAHGGSLGATGLSLVVFAIVAGLAFVFHERAVEITFGKVATIKAAAQQATTDANEIATIRQRVEAQAATLDLVAKASSDATKLLDDLKLENNKADEKLKELVAKTSLIEEKTSSIVRLPDGRTRIGAMVSGEPFVLKNIFDQVVVAFNAKDYPGAYKLARNAIQVYEETKTAEGGVAMTTGSTVTAEGVAMLYSIGAELALRAGDNADGLKWVKVAIASASSQERQALLVMALLSNKLPEQAQTVISENLGKPVQENDKFKALLQGVGVLPK